MQVFPAYFGGLEIELGAPGWYYASLKIYNKFAGISRKCLGTNKAHLYKLNGRRHQIPYSKGEIAKEKIKKLYNLVRVADNGSRKSGLDITRIERRFIYPVNIQTRLFGEDKGNALKGSFFFKCCRTCSGHSGESTRSIVPLKRFAC